MRNRFWYLGFLVLLFPQLAHAHLVSTGAGPFYDGSAHFFVSFEEILPVIALSLYAGLRGTRYARWTLVIVPACWILGSGIGMRIPDTPLFLVSTVLLLLCGVLLASDWKISVAAYCWIAAVISALLGFVNGVAMRSAGASAVLGAVIAALIIAVFASALAVKLSAGWTRIAIRVAGSWLAALGLLSLGWSIRSM